MFSDALSAQSGNFSEEERLSLAPCKHLRTITAGIPLNCSPISLDGHHGTGTLYTQQNLQIWKPALRVLLDTCPGTLTAVSIGISFIREAEDEDEATVGYSSLRLDALRALSWDMLDQVLDRQPRLRNVDIIFPDLLDMENVRRTIRALCSERVNKVLRFILSSSVSNVM